MSQIHTRGPKSPSMNMTPMIDVTFQLIIFFMLINNIVSEEAVTLTVPKLWEPKVVELGEIKRVTVNIVPAENPEDRFDEGKDPLAIDGSAVTVKVGLKDFGFNELDQVTESLKDAVAQNEEVQVMLRADAGTKYKYVQEVMAKITQAKIKLVNLVAFMPDEGPLNLNPN